MRTKVLDKMPEVYKRGLRSWVLVCLCVVFRLFYVCLLSFNKAGGRRRLGAGQ